MQQSYYDITQYDQTIHTLAMSDMMPENTFFWLEKVALPVQYRPALLNTKNPNKKENI